MHVIKEQFRSNIPYFLTYNILYIYIFCLIQIEDLNPSEPTTITLSPGDNLPLQGQFPVDEIRISFIANGNVTISGIFVRACNIPGKQFIWRYLNEHSLLWNLFIV